MSGTSSQLQLLGLAEELSSATAHLGDPASEQLLGQVLDRVVNAVVDVTQERDTLSRTALPPGAPGPPAGPPDLTSADLASCSALAARCHRLAALLDEVADQRLAGQVADALRTTADGLQRVVQDLPSASASQVRQRFLRALRRATAQLDAAAS